MWVQFKLNSKRFFVWSWISIFTAFTQFSHHNSSLGGQNFASLFHRFHTKRLNDDIERLDHRRNAVTTVPSAHADMLFQHCGWMDGCQAERSLLRCVERQDTWDVDENLWPNAEDSDDWHSCIYISTCIVKKNTHTKKRVSCIHFVYAGTTLCK